MLTAHFLIPAGVPGDNSPPATIIQFVLHHRAAILLTAWLQGFGPLPYVLFALGVVYLAGGITRFAGWITMLASAVILTLSLIDAAFTIAAVEAVIHGQAAMASVSFDLIAGPGNDAVGRVFLIAPPLLLPLGAVLLGSRLLPRPFGHGAVAAGIISIILGLAALFSSAAFSLAIVLIIAENVWVLAAALALMIPGWSALVVPRPTQPMLQITQARGGPVETAKDPASMVDRWRRSSSSKSPSTAQNLSASLVSGARCWGTSYRRHRRGLLLGTISIARCRLRIRVHGSHALIPQVRARDCSSSAFPKARWSRTGCILTCGSAPGSWVKSAWPHLRPNAHDWSRSARYACDYCLPMTTTSRAS